MAIDKLTIDKLCLNAGKVIAMLCDVFKDKKNVPNVYMVTLYSAGLAGIACHEAVKALNGKVLVLDGKNGKRYYMGEDMDKYLHADDYSVSRLARAVTDAPDEALKMIVERQAKTVGSDEFKVAGNLDPADVYKNVKGCWDGIFENMTTKFCDSPEQWPVLYGIVLQNVMAQAVKSVPRVEVFNMAVDVACAMAKMDKDSL